MRRVDDWTCLWEADALLGEGPLWDARDGCLWWVDIKRQHIHRCELATGGKTTFEPPLQVTALAPRAAGGFVAATRQGLAVVDPEADRYDIFATLEPDRPHNRSNDGKLDPAGRFWCGTMDDREGGNSGALYSLDANLDWHRRDDGYGITNGPAFSPDGRTMYHTDTLVATIYAFDLASDGTPSNKRPHLRFREVDGNPDGMTVDAEGCLWVAVWNGWSVRRFSPGGDLLAEHALPAAQITSVEFGGENLDRLFATSAAIGLNEEARKAQPLAGALFELRGHGTAGVARIPFGG